MSAFEKVLVNLRWLPSYAVNALRSSERVRAQKHLVIAVADHFEPCFRNGEKEFPTVSEQVRRMREWTQLYPDSANDCRDADGYAFKHTYFYPAEHYHPDVVGLLAEHCAGGWGETEIHLHHGIERPDTPENTREVLSTFRDQLVQHGCLSAFDGESTPRYAFVHGNWALANSNSGRFCGIDNELQILGETGCYADFTLPSAPDPSQVPIVNAIYECGLPMYECAPHRIGAKLQVGRLPVKYPVIVQGPLALFRRAGKLYPGIENGELTTQNPPTLERLAKWREAGVSVEGRPEWCFIKLHCHGMIPDHKEAMLGEPKKEFLRALVRYSESAGVKIHFATCREMFNMILAACDGQDGSPGEYRDYRLKLLSKSQLPRQTVTIADKV